MSLNKLYILFSGLALFYGCTKDSNEGPAGLNKFESESYLTEELREVTGFEASFSERGMFAADSMKELAAGVEIMDKKNWGIKFFFFEIMEDTLIKKYETPLLNGSFKDSKVEKLMLPGFDHYLIYYNSLNYFMGSGGGEILAYIIDLKDQKVYYSHLVSEPDGKTSFYLSDSNANEVTKFLTNIFKKDFPNLSITSKDPVLD